MKYHHSLTSGKLFLFIFTLVFAVGFSSCSYKNRNAILLPTEKPSGDEPVFVINRSDTSGSTYSHRIKSGDKIAIRFLNNYDLSKTSFNVDATMEVGYVIDDRGLANMPLVGKVQLSGLTREEASRKLEKLYSSVLNNPIIEVSIISIKVNVFGEVGSQGKYLIDRDNLSLIDLLAEAGGVTNKARKKSIRIIRGNPKNPEIIVVDLRRIGSMKYQELLMQDNDIVIVDAMRVYNYSDAFQAGGTALQPFLFVVNTLAIVYTISR
jgi:polysaccharide export outer membrane protein